MAINDQKRKAQIDRLYELKHAITVGLPAIHLMALSVADSVKTFFTVAVSDPTGTSEEIISDGLADLEGVLRRVSDLLEYLGDSINARDGVGDNEDHATRHAFKYVHRAMKNAPQHNEVSTHGDQ